MANSYFLLKNEKREKFSFDIFCGPTCFDAHVCGFLFCDSAAIEKVWLLPYEELLKLWVLGSLLVGVAAIPAGWLSDRWSRSGMMLVMFLGLGISSLLCGISYNKTTLFIGLTFLGLFCAIYHPVAIAWVVNSSKKKGRALGINGIFGVMGIGLGGIFAKTFFLNFWQRSFAGLKFLKKTYHSAHTKSFKS